MGVRACVCVCVCMCARVCVCVLGGARARGRTVTCAYECARRRTQDPRCGGAAAHLRRAGACCQIEPVTRAFGSVGTSWPSIFVHTSHTTPPYPPLPSHLRAKNPVKREFVGPIVLDLVSGVCVCARGCVCVCARVCVSVCVGPWVRACLGWVSSVSGRWAGPSECTKGTG